MGVRSVPQYLAAVSMVHHMAGHLNFSAFDEVTRVLVWAWRRQDPAPVQHHRPVPIELILRLLDVGLSSEEVLHVRAACSVVLDFIFMNRAQSGHFILIEDYRVEDGVLMFRERRSKLRNDPTHHVPLLAFVGRPRGHRLGLSVVRLPGQSLGTDGPRLRPLLAAAGRAAAGGTGGLQVVLRVAGGGTFFGGRALHASWPARGGRDGLFRPGGGGEAHPQLGRLEE